ncbi:MAG: hypothetical protein WD407_05335 [Rhodospirillales bacterium]
MPMNSALDTAIPQETAFWPYLVLAIGAGSAGVLAFYLQPADLWPARLLLLLLWGLCIWLLLRDGLAVLFLSPIAIMGGLSIFAYSFLPALIPLQSKYIYVMRNWIHDLPPYLNSLAEALIIAFSALMLLTLVVIAFTVRLRDIRINVRTNFHPYVRLILVSCLTFSLIFQGLWSVNEIWPQLPPPTGILRQIHHALPALQTVALTALFIDSLSRGRKALSLVCGLAAITVLVLATAGIAKTPIFHSVSLVIVWFALSALTLKKRFFVIGGISVLLALVLTLSPFVRPGESSGWKTSQEKSVYMVKSFWSQSTSRQLGTGRCLHDVTALHWPDSGEGSAFYFLAGLVPRMLWPDKPSLSLGQQYAVRYCVSAPGSTHTASISLLGEPITQAGRVGLAVAMIVLVTALSAVTLLALKTTPYGIIALVALLPWLMDFDQHYALYWANSVKMAIIVLGVLFALAWAQRRLDRRDAQG